VAQQQLFSRPWAGKSEMIGEMRVANLDELIGQTQEFPPFVVERSKIREFALAIGDDNPIYRDKTAAQLLGYEDSPAPPTFGTVIDMWSESSDFFSLCERLGLNPVNVLHGEQAYTYHGLLFPGDIITATSTVTQAVRKSGGSGAMNIITTEKRYVNQADVCVLVVASTIIERL